MGTDNDEREMPSDKPAHEDAPDDRSSKPAIEHEPWLRQDTARPELGS